MAAVTPQRRKTDGGFHRWRWRFLLAWVIVFTALTAWSLRRQADDRAELRREEQRTAATSRLNEQALCALRADARRGLDRSSEFLIRHPQGAFGFTRRDLILDIARKRATLRSLSNVNC